MNINMILVNVDMESYLLNRDIATVLGYLVALYEEGLQPIRRIHCVRKQRDVRISHSREFSSAASSSIMAFRT